MNRPHRTRNLILVCTLTLFAATGAFAGIGGVRKSIDPIPNEYIVVLRDDIPKGEIHGLSRRIARENGGDVRKIWTSALKGFFVRMSEKDAEKLSRHPAVEFVEENASLSFAATTQPTKFDPGACELPITQNCGTDDNRLWHLDRIDQDSTVPSNSFSYCATGAGVRIYIVDSGVHGNHSEFLLSDGTTSRVVTGYNATIDTEDPEDAPDPWPANNPCGGWNTAAVGPMWDAEYEKEIDQLNLGHGTAVASMAAGKKSGIAKDATIVPVKVSRCDGAKARYRQPQHQYSIGDRVFDGNDGAGEHSSPHFYWRAITNGQSANTAAINWTGAVGSVRTDGGVQWKRYIAATQSSYFTVDMLIEGLNWIVDDPGRTGKAVVSLSVSKPVQTTTVQSMWEAIDNVIAAGIPVVAAATNLDGDACSYAPGAFSRDNLNGYANKVITVGGTMLQNDPESDTYVESEPTVDRRWTCPSDSPDCTNGSSGGRCVTLFAPAHKINVASNYNAQSYRGRTFQLPGPFGMVINSGTSWSAPLVAGVIAGYLESSTESASTIVDTIYDQLIANSEAVLDETRLDPLIGSTVVPDTPNLVLRASSVRITADPQSTPASTSGSTVLSVTATGGTGLTYQWFEVNPEFDLTEKRGAAGSVAIAGATSSTYAVPTQLTTKGYWVRVTGCGSADSDIAVVVPRPGAPSNLVATADGAEVLLSWSDGSGAEKYQVERKVSGQPWSVAGTLDATANPLTFTDTPTAPGGMVLYRVRSAKGVSYLDANNLALSVPSNSDIANLNSAGYEALNVAPGYTTFKAQMITELRQAANALAAAAGISTMPFTSSEVLASSLQGQTIKNDYLTDLMTKINGVRTNALVGIPSVPWINEPNDNELIHRSFVEELRNALQ